MAASQTDRATWNEFVAASEFGDVLQCWEWGELKARTAWQPLYFAADEGGRIAATALVLKRPIPHTGRCLFYCPRGPIFSPDQPQALADLLSQIREAARSHGAVAIKADPAIPADSREAALLREAGFAAPSGSASAFGGVQPCAVMKLGIGLGEVELLASFHQKWRYNIRLAERKGVTVTSDCVREDIPTFYEILKVTAERDRFGVRALSYYHDLWDLIIAPGLGRLFMVHHDGAAISGAIAFVLGRQCWYVYGASDNDHRHLMPNHLMQWEMMRWAKSQGCTLYDMRGVSPEVDGEPVEPHIAGLNRFKRGFGAEYMEYMGDLDLVFSPVWYTVVQRALPLVRRLARR